MTRGTAGLRVGQPSAQGGRRGRVGCRRQGSGRSSKERVAGAAGCEFGAVFLCAARIYGTCGRVWERRGGAGGGAGANVGAAGREAGGCACDSPAAVGRMEPLGTGPVAPGTGGMGASSAAGEPASCSRGWWWSAPARTGEHAGVLGGEIAQSGGLHARVKTQKRDRLWRKRQECDCQAYGLRHVVSSCAGGRWGCKEVAGAARPLAGSRREVDGWHACDAGPPCAMRGGQLG